MADINAATWSETDSSNNASSPNGWTSGSMLPSQVEPTARAMMGAIRRWYDHANATVISGGTANAQTLTYPVAPTALVAGDVFVFIVGGGLSNTGAATLNINTLGAIAIRRNGAALVGGELQPGAAVTLAYDGTNFQLLATSSPRPFGLPQVTSGGTANAQTLTYPVAPTALVAGDLFFFIAGQVANTGDTTLNINTLGAKHIVYKGGNLKGAELQTNAAILVVYDGTNFQLLATSLPPPYASLSATPTNPNSTSSNSGVMMGIGGVCTITPSATGKVLVTTAGLAQNDTANDGVIAILRYGTGTAPANGAAPTGTQIGNTQSANMDAALKPIGFAITGVISGLALGTAIWLDLTLASLTGGSSFITAISVSAVELP